ncbi:MAG: hypothetical protein J6M18_05775 [Actinomycetaceae bacterium]|nr:hypothetical protein [Actinomycetaceae bacterium]
MVKMKKISALVAITSLAFGLSSCTKPGVAVSIGDDFVITEADIDRSYDKISTEVDSRPSVLSLLVNSYLAEQYFAKHKEMKDVVPSEYLAMCGDTSSMSDEEKNVCKLNLLVALDETGDAAGDIQAIADELEKKLTVSPRYEVPSLIAMDDFSDETRARSSELLMKSELEIKGNVLTDGSDEEE